MSSGAVIDLGGTAQTVASLSGSGVVSNGILTVADQISVAVGDTLVIPYGSTYTCAPGTGAMVDETAGTVTLKHNAAEIAVTDPETSAVTTNVYDTVAGAFAAYSEGTLTVHENATLDFGTTEVSISGIELDEGVVLTFTQNAPWTTTISAGVLVNTRMASTYVWTPAENSTDWAALSNWRIGAVTPVALPGANDTVTFPVSDAPDFNCWVVELTSDVYATNVVVNGDMKFSGGQIHTGNVGGIGTITLNGNAGFHTYDMENVNLEVTNNLVIVGTGNRFQTQGSNSYMNGGSIDVLGCVTGNGEITTVGKRSRVRLHGDWSEFTGTVNAQDDGVPRHALRLMAAQASSSNAVYNIYMSNESSGNSAFVETSSGSYTTGDNYHYYFGALNGRITIYQKYNNTLEIGALNQDCAFTGNIAATSRNHIKKVGTATLKFSGSGLGRLEVAGGVFSSATESAIPAEGITFSGSDGFFDPTTNTVDFASKLVNSTTAPIGLLITNNVTIGQIPASNTEGLVKKGEGTLTLAAAPLYAGDTYLDGGTLKIPVGANIKVKTNVEGMSVRRDTTTEEGYTVYKLGKKLPLMIMVF
jgi:autotransporter-associated beta strand protein